VGPIYAYVLDGIHKKIHTERAQKIVPFNGVMSSRNL
jgi:hypothetical protein